MSSYPSAYKYSREHEWVNVEGDIATVGITSFAQTQLGEVVFVELAEAGRTAAAGDEIGTIESVKAVGELYSPLTGTITERNADVLEDPELLNADPHGKGWLVRMTFQNAAELDALMDSEAYAAYVAANS
ncbi:glycine cleavage system protein GcvH [Myxococcota bacterium]|nr:glycine cleavage system protein GcvH [Myxococcota bacterium]